MLKKRVDQFAFVPSIFTRTEAQRVAERRLLTASSMRLKQKARYVAMLLRGDIKLMDFERDSGGPKGSLTGDCLELSRSNPIMASQRRTTRDECGA
jgi:hypothetical protein